MMYTIMFLLELTLLSFLYLGTECELTIALPCHTSLCIISHDIHYDIIDCSTYKISGSIFPVTVVQAEGLDAIFLCQPPTNAGSIEWLINGTSFHNVNASAGQIRKQGRGEETEALIIPALVQFNQTSDMCILYIIEPNGTVAFIESSPAMLIVQGIS